MGEGNWEEAMRIMGEIGETHTKEFIEDAERSLTRLERYYYVEGHVLKPNVYVTPSENGYTLTLRYVVDAWQRRRRIQISGVPLLLRLKSVTILLLRQKQLQIPNIRWRRRGRSRESLLTNRYLNIHLSI